MKAVNFKQLIKIIFAAVIMAFLLRTFVVDGFIVSGDSMSPSILEDDYIFIDRISYLFSEPKRGDIVVVQPRSSSAKIIKRVIGLPGERISVSDIDGNLHLKSDRRDAGIVLVEDYLNFPYMTPNVGISEIKLDPKEYFVLGDNRFISIDSRELGPVDRWDIKGKVFFLVRIKSLSVKFLNNLY